MKQKLLALCFLFATTTIHGQDTIIHFWQQPIPGAIDNPAYKQVEIKLGGDVISYKQVTEPTISVFLAKGNRSATSILICPGGAYVGITYQHEGLNVAKWLNQEGINAFVLKYRLPNDKIMDNKSTGPLMDALEAIRYIRSHAKVWGLDTTKIGIMGFSAGGHLASTVSNRYNDNIYKSTINVSARPDFSVLLYPVISMDSSITHKTSRKSLLGAKPTKDNIAYFSNDLQVSSRTPPTFIAHSENDTIVPVINSIQYYLAMKKNKVAGELHIFEKGGHGYGINKGTGTQLNWPNALKEWLQMRGLLL